MAPRSAAEWARLIAHPDPSARAEAAHAMRQCPPADAVEPLRAALSDGDAEVRRHAAESTGLLGPPMESLAPGLVSLLGGNDEAAADAAARALEKVAPAAASVLSALLTIVASDRPEVRRRALAALRFLPGVVAALVAEAERGGDRLETALEILGDLGREARDALPMLERLSTSPDPAVRSAAARARRRIQPPRRAKRDRCPARGGRHRDHAAREVFVQLDASLRDWPDAPDEATDLVFMMHPCDWQALEEAVADRPLPWRQACAALLGNGPAEGQHALRKLARDSDPGVATEATDALAELARAWPDET